MLFVRITKRQRTANEAAMNSKRSGNERQTTQQRSGKRCGKKTATNGKRSSKKRQKKRKQAIEDFKRDVLSSSLVINMNESFNANIDESKVNVIDHEE